VYTAYTGCSTLVRLKRRRVVVRFYFKSTGKAIAQVNQTSVFFTGFYQQVFTFAR
jgi:hypothetical protein